MWELTPQSHATAPLRQGSNMRLDTRIMGANPSALWAPPLRQGRIGLGWAIAKSEFVNSRLSDLIFGDSISGGFAALNHRLSMNVSFRHDGAERLGQEALCPNRNCVGI